MQPDWVDQGDVTRLCRAGSLKRLTAQLPSDCVELFQIPILDSQCAAFSAMIDTDLKTERIGQPFLKGARVGIFRGLGSLRFSCCAASFRRVLFAHVRFELAYAQAFIDDFLRDPLCIGLAEQKTCVTC